MNDYYLIVPQATENLIPNPSFEMDANGWEGVRSGMERVGGFAAGFSSPEVGVPHGRTMLQVDMTTIAAEQGVNCGIVLADGETYSYGIDVWAPAGKHLQVCILNNGVRRGLVDVIGTGAWQRVEGVASGTTDDDLAMLYIYKPDGIVWNPATDWMFFYVDGAQLERLPYATTYVDGDQPGCTWTGRAHYSSSVRAANYRAGGRRVYLAAYNAHLVSQSDTGMAPISHRIQPYAVLPGASWQGYKVTERSMTVTFSMAGDGQQMWHQRRADLLAAIAPNAVYPPQPFTLGYTGAGREVSIPCLYDDGMRMTDGKQDIENLPIKLLCPSPFWQQAYWSNVKLKTPVPRASSILMHYQPELGWAAMSTLNVTVTAVATRDDGTVYLAGSSNGGYRVYRWDGYTAGWTVLATANNNIYAIVPTPDGGLLLGGAMTLVGSTACSLVAKLSFYNQVTAVSSGMPSGGVVYSLSYGPDGVLYAGGNFRFPFSGFGVGTTRDHLVKLVDNQWVAVVSAVLDARVTSLVMAPDGYLYVGGWFTTAGAGQNRIFRTTGSDLLPVGSGFNNTVDALMIGPNQDIIAGGTFSASGATPLRNIAAWDGYRWRAVGGGINQTHGATQSWVSTLTRDERDRVVVSGVMQDAGGVTTTGMAYWNGSRWQPRLYAPETSTTVSAITAWAYSQTWGVIGALSVSSGTVVVPQVTTVTNVGTVEAYPIITIVGAHLGASGTNRIVEITNATNHTTLYLDLVLLPDEIVTIDLTETTKPVISSLRGALTHTIQSGSQTAQFCLQPGANTIQVAVHSAAIQTYLAWQPQFWSLDS